MKLLALWGGGAAVNRERLVLPRLQYTYTFLIWLHFVLKMNHAKPTVIIYKAIYIKLDNKKCSLIMMNYVTYYSYDVGFAQMNIVMSEPVGISKNGMY